MKNKRIERKIQETLIILSVLGMPKAQQNERSALTLLALLNLTADKSWAKAEKHLIGITPIMDWIRVNYKKDYAPNTRETIRRQTMHQFMSAGIALINPDDPKRPVNSPQTVYQIEETLLRLLQLFHTSHWQESLEEYLSQNISLQQKYDQVRKSVLVPVQITDDKKIELSPGKHSKLIRSIIEDFAPRFAPGSQLIYAGDTASKWGHFDQKKLSELGIEVDSHGKMPDVVLYFEKRNWLILIEAVTSHGPVDSKRHEELQHLFRESTAGLVYVTAFQNRALMGKFLSDIAWETEVWVANSPSHLIHFNGERFLGPYIQ